MSGTSCNLVLEQVLGNAIWSNEITLLTASVFVGSCHLMHVHERSRSNIFHVTSLQPLTQFIPQYNQMMSHASVMLLLISVFPPDLQHRYTIPSSFCRSRRKPSLPKNKAVIAVKQLLVAASEGYIPHGGLTSSRTGP